MKLNINFEFYTRLFEKIYVFLIYNLVCLPSFMGLWLTFALPVPFLLRLGLLEVTCFFIMLSMIASWQSLIAELQNYDHQPLRRWGRQLRTMKRQILKVLLGFQALMSQLALDFAMILTIPLLLKIEFPILLVVACLATNMFVTYLYFQLFTPYLQGMCLTDQLKLTFFSSIKKWGMTLSNTLLLVTIIGLACLVPQFGLFMTPTIGLYLMAKNCQVLAEIGKIWQETFKTSGL